MRRGRIWIASPIVLSASENPRMLSLVLNPPLLLSAQVVLLQYVHVRPIFVHFSEQQKKFSAFEHVLRQRMITG